jgi:23S rRNA U2552 (ribose-2'-O)-methylase RlmE/FtsJ
MMKLFEKKDGLAAPVSALKFRAKDMGKNPLYEIFCKNKDGSVHKWHHYFQIYDRHFSKYVGKKANILEIGIDKGGSVKMWRKYFGKGVNVYGLDIDPAAKKYSDPKNGVNIFIGDQSDRKFMRGLMKKLPKIDILIDDGGHTTKQQINTFLECYDKIAEDGIYLCEDLHTNYWPSFIDSKETFVDFAKKHIDYLNWWFYGDKNSDWKGKKNVPKFTAITHSICFYNSIIVFEKQRVMEPCVERR